MNSLRVTFYVLAASLLSLSAADPVWHQDLAAAKKIAAEDKKDLLLSFTGSDWCPGCIMLKEQVLSQDEFMKGVEAHFVLVELDYPKDQSKQEPGVLKSNELLLDQYFVEEFPTVILTDEWGRPFARTSLSIFQPKGPATYVKYVVDLKERRTLRDEALSSAEKLEGVDKAKALLDAIADFSDMTIDAFYPHVVEAILAADADDQTGFQAARDYRKAVGSYEEDVEKLFAAGKFKEAMVLARTFIADHDPTGLDLQHILMGELMALVEMGENADAFALLDRIKAIAPASQIGQEADRMRGRLEDYFSRDEPPARPAPAPTDAAPAVGG